MSKSFSYGFYHSRQWKDMRDFIMKRDYGLCQRCRRMGRARTADAVHHITPLTPDNINDPSVTLNPDNLEAVCKECHERIHEEIGYGAFRGEERYEPRVGFDVYGNVVELGG